MAAKREAWYCVEMSIRCALVSRSQHLAIVLVCLAMTCAARVVFAQSENDFKTIEKARSMYLTSPVPSSISCEVSVDWDGFFQRLKIEQTEATKERTAKLKAMKISLVTRDAEHTEVKIDSDNASNGLTDGLRQQLQGFFQIYWSEAYGRLLVVKPEDHFGLTAGPEGYLLKTQAGSTKVTIEMNKAYLITRTSFETPQMSAVAIPGFARGEDGLLRLHSLDQTIDMGATKMVVNTALDYQRVGSYDIPQHLSMALPGSFSFEYTLSGCEVKGESSTTPKS
jgi:hypothetical protein